VTGLVLKGGRVIDPGSDSDAVMDVLVVGGSVAAVGPDLHADVTVDVSGQVVGPGFVDLHSHVHSIAGQRLQAFDGVTTSLELEAGLAPVDVAYARAGQEGRVLHYGFSASWAQARGKVLVGHVPKADVASCFALLGDPAWQRTSTAAERARWLELLRRELEAGALGIGVLMGYAPHTDPAEYVAVGHLAAEAGVATYTHVRELVELDPDTPVDGSTEVVRVAGETGAHMHHCHVNSTSGRHVERVLATLAAAQAEGAPVTVEAYPYGAGATNIGAYFLAPDRLAARGLGPSSVVVLASGERIADEARLLELRAEAPGTPCFIEHLDERDPSDAALLARSLSYPGMLIASDAMPVFYPDGSHERREWPLPPGGVTHPRTAGTFTRTLRRMVRETGAWSWLEAFRRCSYLPARVLDFAPAARTKGHLGVGADADIVVIDPTTVTDAATYSSPTTPAVGVRQLLVAGTPVIRDGELVADAFPGRPLRAEPR
jgi:N-acyl-D-aspartate/D-glutamate deacylase